MANTLKFGNGEWYGKKDTILAYNDENSNYKPLPFDFSRASSATVINKDGLIEEVGSGQPRIDYKDDSKGALLLEPSRTNSITYSEDFSQWTTSNSTVIENNTTSPDGSINAYKLYPDSYGGYRNLNIGGQRGGLNTISIFAKAGEIEHLVLIDHVGTGAGVDFNLSTGVATDVSPSGFESINMIYYGNGWYRCIATAIDGYAYWILSDDGGITVTANGTDGLYVWGAQVEQGSYPTSYIPTQGSAVTRLADTMPNHLNINPLNIGNSYTLFLDTDLNNVENNRVFSEIENSASSDVFTIRNVIGGIRVYNNLDGQYPTNALQSSTNKWAIRIDGTSYKIFGANSSLSGSLSTARDIGEIKFYGELTELKINNFNIYNTALSDAECESLVN